MANSLLDKLVDKEQREVSGSDTASRFDYQKNWAFCEMIDRHQADQDYMVAFEFHDDVLFFHSEKHPDAVDFIQVKTSKKLATRKITDITNKKKESGSIVGKMLLNASKLEDLYTVRLILVSNNAFEFSDADICAKDMDEKYKKKFISKVKEEFPDFSEQKLNLLHFRVSNIPVDQIETFLKGKAHELFEKRFGKNFTMNVSSWLRLIQGEIIRKNNYSPANVNDANELISNKCLSKTFISQTLNEVESKHKNIPDFPWVKSKLSEQGVGDIDLINFDKESVRALSDYNDPNNEECALLQKSISCKIDSLADKQEIYKLLNEVYLQLVELREIPTPYQSKYYIYALIVLVLYEKQ